MSKLRSSDEQAARESVEVVVSQALPQAGEALGAGGFWKSPLKAPCALAAQIDKGRGCPTRF